MRVMHTLEFEEGVLLAVGTPEFGRTPESHAVDVPLRISFH